MTKDLYKYNVSVMCPTRKRVEGCISSCDGLLEHAHTPDLVEILLIFDEDDTDSYDKIKEYYKDKENVKLFISERYGYKYLHKYYNFLAKEADGKWLFVWNDDAVIGTSNWDLIPVSYGNEFRLISCAEDRNGESLFPLFPKKWADLAGRVSNNCSTDSWVEFIARDLGIFVKDFRLHINHLQGTPQFNDETVSERVYDRERFHSQEQRQERYVDLQKIKEYLDGSKKRE
jgi:hypothetical protein